MAVIAAAGIGLVGALASSKAQKQSSDNQLAASALTTLVARELHDWWKNYYSTCDAKMITEVCAIPPYVPQYELVEGRTRAEVLRTFARARYQIQRCQNIYCVGATAQQCNFMSGIEAIALADSVNFGFRREETEAVQRNQLRLENIFRWLGLGRNLLSQSNAAAGLAGEIAARVGAQAGKMTNGWMQFAGFLESAAGKRLFGDTGKKIADVFSASSKGGENNNEMESQNSVFNPPSVVNDSGGTGYAGSDPGQAGGSGFAYVGTSTDNADGLSQAGGYRSDGG